MPKTRKKQLKLKEIEETHEMAKADNKTPRGRPEREGGSQRGQLVGRGVWQHSPISSWATIEEAI